MAITGLIQERSVTIQDPIVVTHVNTSSVATIELMKDKNVMTIQTSVRIA